MSGIVKYTSDSGQEITLTQGIVAQYIAGNQNVTPQEFMTFAALCKNYGLNPFIREAYMIKYGNQPATIVTGKDVFTKRAYRHPKFQGFQAGITVQNQQGQRLKRKGSAIYEGETVIGGWAEVYLADYQVPIYDEVSFSEYAARKKDGTLNKTWSSKPGTMIRKVALVHALREAFPEEFNGMYDQSEMGVDEQPDEPIQVPAEIIPEQNQEAAYEYTEEF